MYDAKELMDMFEDLSKPIKQIEKPKEIKVLMKVEDKRSQQRTERTQSGKEYALEEKQKALSSLSKASKIS